MVNGDDVDVVWCDDLCVCDFESCVCVEWCGDGVVVCVCGVGCGDGV